MLCDLIYPCKTISLLDMGSSDRVGSVIYLFKQEIFLPQKLTNIFLNFVELDFPVAICIRVWDRKHRVLVMQANKQTKTNKKTKDIWGNV